MLSSSEPRIGEATLYSYIVLDRNHYSKRFPPPPWCWIPEEEKMGSSSSYGKGRKPRRFSWTNWFPCCYDIHSLRQTDIMGSDTSPTHQENRVTDVEHTLPSTQHRHIGLRFCPLLDNITFSRRPALCLTCVWYLAWFVYVAEGRVLPWGSKRIGTIFHGWQARFNFSTSIDLRVWISSSSIYLN